MESLRLGVKACVEKELQSTINNRRWLHQNPELSFQEFETSAFIKNELDNYGILYDSITETSVLAWVDGTKDIANEDVIVLRADIDALPIDELNDVSYKSRNKGVMHACGHDFHTSNLIATAKILKNLQHTFSGRVLLLFQHAEERIPGGAQEVLNSGKLKEYGNRIKAVIGLHVSPQLQVGEVGLCQGKFMASSDEFYIKIIGQGGHAAEPHKGIDPIIVSTQLLMSLQQIVSRHSDPTIPSVLTFGRFIGNGAVNVIPDEVIMEGTFRTMDERWREIAVAQIQRLIMEIPKTLGADVELQVKRGYPFLLNDTDLTFEIKRYFLELFEDKQVKDVGIWMAAEDFAYYSHRYPSLFFLLGVTNELNRAQFGLHNPHFDLDEAAFVTGMSALCYSTIRLLNKGM